MQLTFRHLAVLVAIICFSLAGIWLVAPGLLLTLWEVPGSSQVQLMGRRSAALFLGIAVMFFCARNAGPGPGRNALMQGFATACALLACLGMLELATGRAGVGILLAVAVEALIAGLFVAFLWRQQDAIRVP